MDIGAVLLLLAVVIIVGLFASRPFLQRQLESTPADRHPARPINQERSSTLAEYERQLNALKELEFDHSLGKIPEEDFPQQRQALMQNAAGLLRRMDEMNSGREGEAKSSAPESADPGEAGGEAIVVAASQPAASQVAAGDDLEALIAARRRTRQEKASGFCPGCGKPIQKSDRFCPRCGTAIG
jgi:rubrerythrin